MSGTPQWYRLTVEECFARLESGIQGLTGPEAAARLARHGFNELEVPRTSALLRFLSQFHNPLVYILLLAAAMTTFLSLQGEELWADTVVILGVVVLNAILGFVQEGKAESALHALKRMSVPECKVVREGVQEILPTRELVPGDVVVLEAGDRIPADLRLFVCHEAAADESVLTGESVPVEKHTAPLHKSHLSPGDQRCIAFSGTFLSRGSASGVVVATALGTEFGKIAALVKETPPTLTPLQRKVADFTRVLIIAILAIGMVNFLLGLRFGYPAVYSFLGSVSLVVAAIPEMLPVIVTAILALAATHMARRNALIRHLPAAETLGCTTVICSDKTGTLTKNEMTVTRIHAGGRDYRLGGVGYEPVGEFRCDGAILSPEGLEEPLRQTLRAGWLCNNAALTQREGRVRVVGDPTEGALLVSARKGGEGQGGERLAQLPFDAQRMYMAVLVRHEGVTRIWIKGSPERLLELCATELTAAGPRPVAREAVLAKAGEMAGEALRVLAMAVKEVPAGVTELRHGDLEGLCFLGLQGMIDPPRPEAVTAVANCRQAGIRTVMITGDHLRTAKAVAAQLGIVGDGEHPALDGRALAVMEEGELERAVEEVSVFARVAPEHKLRIARALQRHGHVVAMTGDGVNDAPALKAADIGVAMGITGTEVSKEAASMVLTDDNFATIVGAVEEGRHAWNNLEKAILYTLPTNGGQALLVMGAVLLAPLIPLFNVRLPLEPVQILWVNLFDSVFLTMPLMMEPKERHILESPPRQAGVKIADALFVQRVILMGLAIAVPGFLVYHHFGAAAVVGGEVVDPLLLTQAQTAAFWAVLLVHFGFVMSARSIFRSAFTFSPFTNLWLLGGIGLSVLARLVANEVPLLSELFRLAEFPAEWWVVILPCLLPGFIALELDKWVRHRWGGGHP